MNFNFYCVFHLITSLFTYNLSFVVIRSLILVRADISRLPFASSSVDAVHAGAAIHCWPSPSTGVSICSVLNNFFSCSGFPHIDVCVMNVSRWLK